MQRKWRSLKLLTQWFKSFVLRLSGAGWGSAQIKLNDWNLRSICPRLVALGMFRQPDIFLHLSSCIQYNVFIMYLFSLFCIRFVCTNFISVQGRWLRHPDCSDCTALTALKRRLRSCGGGTRKRMREIAVARRKSPKWRVLYVVSLSSPCQQIQIIQIFDSILFLFSKYFLFAHVCAATDALRFNRKGADALVPATRLRHSWSEGVHPAKWSMQKKWSMIRSIRNKWNDKWTFNEILCTEWNMFLHDELSRALHFLFSGTGVSQIRLYWNPKPSSPSYWVQVEDCETERLCCICNALSPNFP